MYKLSNQAVEDFEFIYEYTWGKSGYQQTDKYTTEMEQLFLLLEKNALMGHNCPAIEEGTRQYNHRQHAIFYQNADYGIFIIRILHQQMNPVLHFSQKVYSSLFPPSSYVPNGFAGSTM